jgi:hypothetical protein
MALNIYSPADVLVLIGGVFPLSGYVDGTFLEISKDIAPYRSRRTPDGTTARLYVNDRNYTIRFILAQSSDSNDKLTKLQQIDEITQKGLFPVLIKDKQGSSLLFSPTAWIEEIPSQSFGTGIEPRTWQIKATSCANYVGGNSSTDNLFQDIIKSVITSSPQLGELVGEVF